MHSDILTVLAHNQQLLLDLELFCTNPVEFFVFTVDLTFNIFKEKIYLTVTTNKNLKLIYKETTKPPVFIGPIFMHQSKNWNVLIALLSGGHR